MRILVTGGSGFIGTNLIQHFADRGESVLNFDIAPPRNRVHRDMWRRGDICDPAVLKRLVTDFAPEVIVHMAARTDLRGKSVDDYAANTRGVANVIAALQGAKTLARIVFASSRLVCRIGFIPSDETEYCPTTAYGQSKVIGERLVRAAAEQIPCPWVIVRPTSIWGPWFDVPYKTFFLTIAKGRYFHPGRQSIRKSFGFVGNTVHQVQRLIDASGDAVSRKTLYLADYPPLNVAQFANAIQVALAVAPVRTVPVGVLRPLAVVGDMLKACGVREPPLTSFRLDNLLTPMVHDLTALEAIVGSLPVSMEEGVRITVDWLRAQGEVR